jgi:hypothetical protein
MICSNFQFNFRFKVIWHRQSLQALVLCYRLKWCHCHAIRCACGLIMLVIKSQGWHSSPLNSQKCKSTSPSAIQVKNHWKTIKKKLDRISQPEKGKQTVGICYNVKFAPICICTVHDNADRITESVKSGNKVFV